MTTPQKLIEMEFKLRDAHDYARHTLERAVKKLEQEIDLALANLRSRHEEALKTSALGAISSERIAVPGSSWCTDMSKAPRNARILIKSAVKGGIYAAQWVQSIKTDDEVWLIGELPDGSHCICENAKAWRLIPDDAEVANG